MSKYNATFTSIWDENSVVYSRCYISKRKRLVTRMERNNISSDVGYVIQAFIKLFDLSKEDGVDLSEIKYVPLQTGLLRREMRRVRAFYKRQIRIYRRSCEM